MEERLRNLLEAFHLPLSFKLQPFFNLLFLHDHDGIKQ